MGRVSKAIAAAVSAGVAGAVVYLQSHSFKLDAQDIAGAAGAFVVAAVVSGITTYRAPANKVA